MVSIRVSVVVRKYANA